MQKWQYKIVHFQADKWTRTGLPKDLGEKFDDFGSEGWELVGTEAIQRPVFFLRGGNTVGMIAYFKKARN